MTMPFRLRPRSVCLLATCAVALALTQQSSRAQSSFEVLHTFVDHVGFPTTLMTTGDGVIYGTSVSGGQYNDGYIFTLTPGVGGQWVRAIVHEFGLNDGRFPIERLTEGPDGALYGMTTSGGLNHPIEGSGTLFRLSRHGDFTVLKYLDSQTAGGRAVGRLLAASDSLIYGVQGRDLFKFRASPFEFTVIHHFTFDEGDPVAGFIQGENGKLYGALAHGANIGYGGRVVSITTDGAITVLHEFITTCHNGTCDPNADGAGLVGGVVQAADHKLYGQAEGGGPSNVGTLFRLNVDGSGFEVLDSTHGPYWNGPYGPINFLTVGPDGAVYGTASAALHGTGYEAYRLTAGGGYATFHTFTADEGQPFSYQTFAGRLLGLSWPVGGTGGPDHFRLVSLDSSGAYASEYLFRADGNALRPSSALVRGADGAWYGTSGYGGFGGGLGMVYRMSPTGDVTSVHEFAQWSEGVFPSGLMHASDGNFYGTTTRGGAADAGALYTLTPSGSYSILHHFAAGDGPVGGALTEGPNGTLYGASLTSVYTLDPDGTFHVLAPAGAGATIGLPSMPLIVEADGTVFGVANDNDSSFSGTTFKIDPAGTETVLHVLTEPEGQFLSSGLSRGADGAMYGVAAGGGTYHLGSIFRATASGGFEPLYSFGQDFNGPRVPMVLGADGRLYGMASNTQATLNLSGGIFRFDPPTGAVEQLHLFDRDVDGFFPLGPLTIAADGLYGTNAAGGTGTFGTAFKFVTPIAPNQSPTAIAQDTPPATPATSANGAQITLRDGGSSDPDGDPLTYTWTGPFGTATGAIVTVPFPIGRSHATLTVSDGHGGTSSVTTGDVIVLPRANDDSYTIDQFGTITVPAPGVLANDFPGSGASVAFMPPIGYSFTDNGGGGFTFGSPSPFAGTVQFGYVIHGATDDSNMGQVTITVRDITPPVFGPVSNISVQGTSSTGAFVNVPVPTATDQGSGLQSVTCDRTSGMFPFGSTTVTCTAKDNANNTSTVHFTVVVSAQPGFYLLTLHLVGLGNPPVTGAVGVIPFGNVCNSGFGSNASQCTYEYPANTSLRLTSNAPNDSTPGAFSLGTGDASACATSTCRFTINHDSEVTATFDPHAPTVKLFTTIDPNGAPGEVGVDSGRCQNYDFHLGSLPSQSSACTESYAPSSLVTLEAGPIAGTRFTTYSNGMNNAGVCGTSRQCSFVLGADTSITASFSALTSIAVDPLTASVNLGQSRSFTAGGTYADGTNEPIPQGDMGTWTTKASMNQARFDFAAAAAGGKVYAIGGITGSLPSSSFLGSIEEYDPTSNTWTAKTPMSPRASLAAATIGDRDIYAVGGDIAGACPVATVEMYDTTTDTWTTKPPLPGGPRRFLSAASVNGKLYVIGGELNDCFQTSGVVLNTVEEFDPNAGPSGTWTMKASMPTARRFFGVGVVNGQIYAVGGDDTHGNLATVEAYDPAANTWTTKAPLPDGRSLHAVAVIDNRLYVVGGNNGGYFNTVFAYDAGANSWSNKKFLPSVVTSLNLSPELTGQRGELAATAVGGRMYALGGITTGSATQAVATVFSFTDSLIWSVGDSSVAKINGSGLATGLQLGSSSIVARSGDVMCSPATCGTLTVVQPVNQAPSVTIFSGNQTLNEGSTFSSGGNFNDFDSHSWIATVDYGDGGGAQPLQLNGTSFSLSHQYGDNGVFTVVVAVADDAGAKGTASITVTVNNVAPTLSLPSSFGMQLGSAVSRCASFFDRATDGPWTATINWGDGTAVQTIGGITAGGSCGGPGGPGGPAGAFALNHFYTHTGTFSVVVSVTDKDGGTGSNANAPQPLRITISKTFPNMFVSSSNPNANPGDNVTFTATVSGPNGADVPTGPVTFTVDGNQAAAVTAQLDGTGHATFSTSTLGTGSHNIGANYGGDGNYQSRFASTTQSVNDPVCATITLTVAGNVPFTQLPVTISSGGQTFTNVVNVGVNRLDFKQKEQGTYHVVFNPPAGYGVTPPEIDLVAACGHNAAITVQVALLDVTPPVLTLPGNIAGVATGPAGAMVSFTVTALDNVNGSVPVTCTPPSGSTFPIGTTTVNCSAQDAAGNVASSNFTVTVIHSAPVCTATADQPVLWPPSHQMVSIGINGVTTADGGAIATAVTSIWQDEPTNGLGDGDTPIDGVIVNGAAQVRAERGGNGDGRFYYLGYTSTTPGGSCSGTVTVAVPHDQGHAPVGQGPTFDSTKLQ